ncbi:MgtC/SapB family protein [Thiobacillus sp.]|uniref:MgtC/SapB family protein n=1 Tax=Thiobacillus sp. TaxID=924 RepID=UPI0017FF8136|nr:MgtC/SapB family protein [Thiobacillus sp.]MBC2731835.1 MgtC/SapB family protein [Thiobacillus sp.]MBC2740573.1 MgtC/SapB family protein [Thiobacillus sp.]MBC2758575.1 MgtC/SapB family protein [Thiobacillus sp.]MBD3812611.1 MgtC/SapB family protein [Betaproteobacteria bacterium]
MDADSLTITIHLLGALFAGGIIGLERSFHGRPAGFRTHALVCLASSLLMLITLYQLKWLPGVPLDTVRTDPTRMAQGIMTGIGFLGAGVIFKEGLSVRGLTTAASIWITAAIGILIGIGFYFPAILGTALTVGTLSLFRWIEAKLPSHFYAHHFVRFDRDNAMPEPELKQFVMDNGFTIANMSYRLSDDGFWFEYRMVIRTINPANISAFAAALRNMETVRAFRISPTGD